MKLPVLSGLYKITNIENGHFYIGSSENIYKRWRRHRYELTHQRHHSAYLQRAWDKYGENNFTWELLTLVEPPQLFEEEAFWITVLAPAYNVGSVGGGDNFSNNPKKEEIKLAISVGVSKKWNEQSFRHRQTVRMLGNSNPNWKDGRSKKQHTCPDCSTPVSAFGNRCKSCCKKGKLNNFYGKHHSIINKLKARERKLRTRLSDSAKHKCKEASIQFFASEAGLLFRKKTSTRIKGGKHFLFGKGHSHESKQKIRDSWRQRVNNLSTAERYQWGKSRGVRVVKIVDDFYFCIADALPVFGKSAASLEFRCKSKAARWMEYELLNVSEFTATQDETILAKLENTKLKRQLAP